MKLDILAFGAHPDDVELGCGGTLAKHAALGYKIGIVDLTPSQLSTRGTVENRAIEAENAAKALGITVRENLGMQDGFFENNHENKMKLVEVIRKYQPEIIFATAPDDRHPDHGRASQMVKEANFLAGLHKIETPGLEPWRAKSVYYYIQFKHFEPDFLVDITGFVEQKMESLKAYASQFYDANSTEPQTVIASKEFMELINGRHAVFGAMGMSKNAEGFISEFKIVADNLFDLHHG
ncbi:MAG: bacillithiol biosynthesis deacetylase BshB1 [Bacteroidetes bacterium]|nr:bacillithiol biosynthesis deacetylase BshB1 [Bacteroidota bacterium]